jgi:hypothetical protein
MDTFKDKQLLDELHDRGDAPGDVWTSDAVHGTRAGELEATGSNVRLQQIMPKRP